MAKKSPRSGKSYKEQYAAYKSCSTRDVNKAKKMVKHLKAHPNDLKAAASKLVGDFRSKPVHRGSITNKLTKGKGVSTLSKLGGKLIGNAKMVMALVKMEKSLLSNGAFGKPVRGL